MNKFDLNNKTAIVTGGAQGFGLAMTKRFLESGANVIIWDLDKIAAEDVKKVHAICVETGNPAGYSFRKEKNKDLVLIGEKKEYEPLSREIFIKKMSKKIL